MGDPRPRRLPSPKFVWTIQEGGQAQEASADAKGLVPCKSSAEGEKSALDLFLATKQSTRQ